MSRKIAQRAYREADLVCVRGHHFSRENEDGEKEWLPVGFKVLNPNPCTAWGEEKQYGHYLVVESVITGRTHNVMSKDIRGFGAECLKFDMTPSEMRDAMDAEKQKVDNEKKVSELRKSFSSVNIKLFLEMFQEIAGPNLAKVEVDRDEEDRIRGFSASMDPTLSRALNRDLNVYIPTYITDGQICAMLAVLGLVDVNDLQSLDAKDLVEMLEE